MNNLNKNQIYLKLNQLYFCQNFYFIFSNICQQKTISIVIKPNNFCNMEKIVVCPYSYILLFIEYIVIWYIIIAFGK